MRQIHIFYLSVLLALLAAGTYRQCASSRAALATEQSRLKAVQGLQSKHQALLWEMQQGALDYPTRQADQAAWQALLLDSLFQQFDTAKVSRTAQVTEAIWRDSAQAVFSHYPDEVERWQALDALEVRSPVWRRVKNHLLQKRADNFLASRIQGTDTRCWFGFKLDFFPAENLVLMGDTLHAEVGDLRFSKYPQKIWVNDRRIKDQYSAVDSVFQTPGPHLLDVRVATSLPYGMRHEAQRRFRFYVVNHSK